MSASEVGEDIQVSSRLRFEPFFVPGPIFMVSASIIWPKPIAFLASFAGALCAATLGFLFARHTARTYVARRIPAQFQHLNTMLDSTSARPHSDVDPTLLSVILIRLVLFEAPWCHWLLGISKVDCCF